LAVPPILGIPKVIPKADQVEKTLSEIPENQAFSGYNPEISDFGIILVAKFSSLGMFYGERRFAVWPASGHYAKAALGD
jgi:hypothetical protein